MNQIDTRNWIKYYRNSLADGELMDAKNKDLDGGKNFISINELDAQSLFALFKKFNKVTEVAEDAPVDSTAIHEDISVDVLIAPFFLEANKTAHGKATTNTKNVYPFWIPATLNHKGVLKPVDQKKPWFVRSVLKPIDVEYNSYPIIAHIDTVDRVLDSHTFNYESWEDYLISCKSFFEKVTGQNFLNFKIYHYTTNTETIIIKAQSNGYGQSIMSVYDDLKETTAIPQLLSNLLSFQNTVKKNIPDAKKMFLENGHYGQYSNQFPLSNSQRKSLLIFETEGKGATLAVNGPPGTGKTTLLQSIVANEIVKAVLKGNTPPKIIASSTNNQAITNILDGFASTNDTLERWLPGLNSLGSYLVSSDALKQKNAKEKGYQIITREKKDLNGFYFTNLHSLDSNDLEKEFTAAFLKSYENENAHAESVEKITGFLKSKVEKSALKIDTVLQIIKAVEIAELQYFPLSQLPELKQTIAKLDENLNDLTEEKKRFIRFRNKLSQFVVENRVVHFLSFIPSLKQIYSRRLALFLTDAPTGIFENCNTGNAVEIKLMDALKEIDAAIVLQKTVLEAKKTLYNALTKLEFDRDTITQELFQRWETFLFSKKPEDKEKIENEFQNLHFNEQANRILDISFRYSAFNDAVHYWEGVWLIKQKTEKLKVRKDETPRNLILDRISYLTPLFISTFHALPGFCTEPKTPLYEFFDLIIVDEAGQVAPEVGVAAFAFAKKALVVGDIHQIEPIWSIAHENIDKGNLQEAHLLNNYKFSDLKELGLICSSGSLMCLAQKASAYAVKENLGGTLLTEHRRCVDELLAFSNHYVYDDMLQPMVGSSKGIHFKDDHLELFLPPLSYLNIPGDSEEKNGSKRNLIEAEAIARWIKIYGDLIMKHYNKGKSQNDIKKLEDILAVITPFSAQKTAILNKFKLFGLSTAITIGTVHALQGAERAIIIFSPVYGGNHTSSRLFFDAGYNMLNVALTRAKQHFIVMGTMRLFDKGNDQKPSGGLARFLFTEAVNELSSAFLFEAKTIHSKNRLDTLEKHQACLKKAFEIALSRIIIVSPFISIHAIIADGILDKIQKAVANNVEVLIYTDTDLDLQNDKKLKPGSEAGREALVAAGATLMLLKRHHNKALAIDHEVVAEGSFNWLSAVRDKGNPLCRHEVSHIFMGDEAKSHIATLLLELGVTIN